MISVILTLMVIGILLWLLNTYVPMDAGIKKIIYVVVILCVVFWLIGVFGLLGHDIPVPRVR